MVILVVAVNAHKTLRKQVEETLVILVVEVYVATQDIRKGS